MTTLPDRASRRVGDRRPLRSAAIHLALGGSGFVVAFPFLWMVLTSLKSAQEASAFPPILLPASPQWSNYADALQAAPFARYFLNSALVAAGVTFSVVACALLAGYAF